MRIQRKKSSEIEKGDEILRKVKFKYATGTKTELHKVIVRKITKNKIICYDWHNRVFSFDRIADGKEVVFKVEAFDDEI